MSRRNNTYNILMYSHDTYGLGHIRRTMAIAAHLRDSNINILILTGSPIAGRFSFPNQVDFVRIPGMIKKTNEEYRPLSIHINARHALEIRKNIITATAKAFQPHLFIVDKEPLGLKKEVLPTLEWIRRCLPGARTILGLRDIMDDAATVRRDWAKKGIYDILDRLYDEIWVYGLREYYNPIQEYAIPEKISRKILFTGYIPRKVPSKEAVRKVRKEQGIQKDEKLVVVTTGGGGDGYAVMDTYLSILESRKNADTFKSILITGPFMPEKERKEIHRRAKQLGVRSYHFFRQMEKILAGADVVVSMGGYNTLCEILSQKTLCVVIPRETPRLEQTIRAQVFHRKNLVEYIPWKAFTPDTLAEKIHFLLQNADVYRSAIARFGLTGIETMQQRIQEIRWQCL